MFSTKIERTIHSLPHNGPSEGYLNFTHELIRKFL